MKKERGITLIALVITIIVLLILAGVTIASLTGENGILAKATKARTETDEATAKEQVQIAVMASYDQDGKLDINTLKKELEKIEGKGSITDTDGNFPVKVTVDGYPFEIDGDGNITDERGGGEVPTPPIVNEIEPGEKVTGENKEYTKNGTAVIPVDFAIVPGLDDVSEGLVISDVANDTENQGNQFVWIPVTSETLYIRNRSFEIVNLSTTAYDDTDYLPSGITNEEEAVRKAGGFYVARYEPGKEETNTLVSKKGAKVWVSISQTDAKAKAKTMFTDNENVRSAMISGIQWDLMMEFIGSKERTDGIGNIYEVTKIDENRHKGSSVGVEKTGNNEADKVCNIYDLEGNAYEYIAEKNTYNGGAPLITRGGNYGKPLSAAVRGNGNGNSSDIGSFRFMLYIN